MAFAETKTLIPLDRVAFYLQIDPYHFNQIYTSQRPLVPSCDDMWYQYGYQSSGKLSREQLAAALKQAEKLTIDHLGWYPVPEWFLAEEQTLPNYHAPEIYSWYNTKGLQKSVILDWGYVQEIGLLTKTLIANVATTFIDNDGDGFDETVEITVATTVTDEEELRVYYPSKDAQDIWEIRPLGSVTIAGGIATIQFPRYLIPLESLVKTVGDPGAVKIGIDGDVDANFLATVDVYRVYTDTTDQMTLYAEYGVCGCASSSRCSLCSNDGCGVIRDSRNSMVTYRQASYNETTEVWNDPSSWILANKVEVNYRAGLMDKTQKWPTKQMSEDWERMISFYALSLIDTKLEGCGNTTNIWQKQTEDLSITTRDRGRVISWDVTNNPFGTTRAAITLWKRIYAPGIRRVKSPPDT